MLPKTTSGLSRIKLHEPVPEPGAGGEGKPLDYPQMYRLRLGDWQVSYAVEHNKLVILVLEEVEHDPPVKEKAGKRPRVKIKNLLENATPVPPQTNKAARIKLRNLLEDVQPEPIEGGDVLKKVKIKLLDLLEEDAEPAESAPVDVMPEDVLPEEAVPEEPVPTQPEVKSRIKLHDPGRPFTKKQ